jgi:hypothetical protein
LGRVGESRKVVVVVENIEEEVDGGKGGKKDEERRVRGILREAKIVTRSKVE